MKHSINAAVASVCLAFAGGLVAAEVDGFLDKAGLESLIVEHKITFVRQPDGNRVKWDLRKNGMLFGENLSRGSTDTARWTIDEKGQLCLKWKGNSADVCRLFAVRDGKTQMFDPATTSVAAATIEQID